MKRKNILILGCGVNGLSTGITLLKRGYAVTIWAKDLPPDTNSDKAAAFWFPYLCSPREKAIPWARMTFEYFQKEILPDTDAGCRIKPFTQLFTEPHPEPWWKDAFPGTIERPDASELPDGYVDAYRIQNIVIDTSVYMPYLVQLFTRLGGTIIQKTVSDIKETFVESDVVVNCSGLGSRELFGDEKVYPIRGQMVKIRKSNFDRVVVNETSPTEFALVVGRTNDIALGGTAEKDNWNLEADPDDTKKILEKVKRVTPELEIGEVVSVSVGLRPGRESIRLEVENFGEKSVVHNYGHGGAGFTLSWGCAKEVAAIVDGIAGT